MKDTFYFRHDSGARQDEKILALRMKHGWSGYGIYWAIIEKLRESTSYMCTRDYNLIAFDLRVPSEQVKSIIEDFNLFEFSDSGELFFSKRLLSDMHKKDELSASRSMAGKKGMEARYNKERNSLDSQHDGNPPITKLQQSYNTVITNKRKDKREYEEKEIDKEKENPTKGAFRPPTLQDVKDYIHEKGYTINAERFIDYYTSNGWMVGKNKMKDWRAAARNWREKTTPAPHQTNTHNINDEWT